jgi:glycosyltransferase involved in cell wall biosynthesis
MAHAVAASGQHSDCECRLCGGIAQYRFSKVLLNKYTVAYFECGYCHSLQTEAPYWLDEAYSEQAEKFDTGKASRTLENFLLLPSLYDLLGVDRDKLFVDWGGGSGLLTRLLRDVGFNYYCYDLYSKSEFAQGFLWQQPQRQDVTLISAFEVVEHFPKPATEWEAVFNLNPDFFICSTDIYNGQGEDWFYLSPENGQHIFFYSAFALALIAGRFNYTAYPIGSYLLFCKQPLNTSTLSRLGSWAPRRRENQLQAFMGWLSQPFRYAIRDHETLALGLRAHQANETIVIDMVFFQLNRSGIARLWETLLRIWAQTPFGKRLLLLDRAHTSPRIDGLRYLDVAPYDYANTDADCANLERICREHGASLFLSTYYSRPLTMPALLMIYDMIPELLGFDLNSPMWREKHLAIKGAARFVCISKNTAADLARYCSINHEKIAVAHCGVDSNFVPATEQQNQTFQDKYGITRPYFLIVGERGSYKNAGLLFSSIHLLPNYQDYQIVCLGGRPQMEPEYLPLIADLDVIMLRATNEEMHCAYSGAIALVYPSMYEGFGLPVVEAMACGCPVITCPGGSIPEIAGNDVLYISPGSTEEMAAALQLVQQADVRQRLVSAGLIRARGYSWKKMADAVQAAVEETALLS